MRRLALLFVLCATLVGCGAIADQVNLQIRIEDAGYTNVSTFHTSTNGTDILEIEASATDPAKKSEQIAEIVWDTYPEHVDQVSITLNGTYELYGADELRSAFGERGVTEKPDDGTDTMQTVFTWLIVGVVVFLLFVVGLIILIVVLVRRSGRKRQQQPPYFPPPPPGWPPAGPPPAA